MTNQVTLPPQRGAKTSTPSAPRQTKSRALARAPKTGPGVPNIIPDAASEWKQRKSRPRRKAGAPDELFDQLAEARAKFAFEVTPQMALAMQPEFQEGDVLVAVMGQEPAPEGPFRLALLDSPIPGEEWFSRAWPKVRANDSRPPFIRALDAAVERCHTAASDVGALLKDYARMSDDERSQLASRADFAELYRFAEGFDLARQDRTETHSMLTKYKKADINHDVPKTHEEWDALLERIRKATSKPGAKSALATQLGVSRQRVTEWLKGRATPNATATLRLVEIFPRKRA